MGSRPRKRAEQMVAAEREIPGIRASAWKSPMIRALVGVIFFEFFGKNFVENNNMAVTKKNRGRREGVEKKESIWFFRKKPMIAAGREPIKT